MAAGPARGAGRLGSRRGRRAGGAGRLAGGRSGVESSSWSQVASSIAVSSGGQQDAAVAAGGRRRAAGGRRRGCRRWCRRPGPVAIGGVCSQAAACAFSSATWRAAGFIRPFSARYRGQAAVTMCRNCSVARPVRGVGGVGGVGQGGRRGRSRRVPPRPSGGPVRRPAARRGRRCGARRRRRAGARIRRASAARRWAGSTAGGRSSAPASASGASSSAPRAVMRGSSSGAPLAARRNARPGRGRRGGWAAGSGHAHVQRVRRALPASPARRHRAGAGAAGASQSSARDGWRGLIASPPSAGPAARIRRPPGRTAWRGGTTARHAPPRAAGRLRSRGPRPGSC